MNNLKYRRKKKYATNRIRSACKHYFVPTAGFRFIVKKVFEDEAAFEAVASGVWSHFEIVENVMHVNPKEVKDTIVEGMVKILKELNAEGVIAFNYDDSMAYHKKLRAIKEAIKTVPQEKAFEIQKYYPVAYFDRKEA